MPNYPHCTFKTHLLSVGLVHQVFRFSNTKTLFPYFYQQKHTVVHTQKLSKMEINFKKEAPCLLAVGRPREIKGDVVGDLMSPESGAKCRCEPEPFWSQTKLLSSSTSQGLVIFWCKSKGVMTMMTITSAGFPWLSVLYCCHFSSPLLWAQWT